MTLVTVLGASGFIGTHLVRKLDELGIHYHAPAKDENLPSTNLGHVIYCIGLTADFRRRPLDTVDAHVCRLLPLLQQSKFESLLYLSSTRVYARLTTPAVEEVPLQLNPMDPSDLYNASKLMGESLALHSGRPVRIARLSNVYGQDPSRDNFLPYIIRDAITRQRIVLYTSLESSKDYVNADDVAILLIQIATRGRQRIYNLASGANTPNAELVAKLRSVTHCDVEVVPGSPTITFPMINIDRIREEFGFRPSHITDDIDRLVRFYQGEMERQH